MNILKWFLLQVVHFQSFMLVSNTQNEYDKLPFCSDSSVPGMVLVSTIDGKFSAINSEGLLKWQTDTGSGSLLISNIHNLELTASGNWIRIIPSLTGSLYRFDGESIDPIPISAESLLRSSFKYSDDLVIAGGLEVKTYGIGLRTGKVLYTCSSIMCTNNSNSNNKLEDILVLERTTQTVRTVETQSGHERWNFTVGYHNIKLPRISCIDPLASVFNWNISAVIPDGLLLASKFEGNSETAWQYQFPSPIVRVWKWNGNKIVEVDLFQVKADKYYALETSPSIYLGMYKKQLYIHESYALQTKWRLDMPFAETNSLFKIPWKPISASGFLTEKDSTALSILYSSEYVNGHGYYLYREDASKKDGGLCQNNNTSKISLSLPISQKYSIGSFLQLWWKEILVTLLTTSLFNLLVRFFMRRQQNQKVVYIRHGHSTDLSTKRYTPLDAFQFNSRFLNDFYTLRCLGKGGFGVVFEVKQKIDECNYAIKRIILPNEETKREAVMREVKALAKLEHSNIVRYFNSWVEKPPHGWQEQYDSDWLRENTESRNKTTESHLPSTSREPLVDSSHFSLSKKVRISEGSISDSFIIFQEGLYDSNQKNSTKTQLMESNDHSKRIKPKQSDTMVVQRSEAPPAFLYIQMQLCQKQSLKEWLIESKDRQFSTVLDIFKQIVSAVEYVHMQGLIHRDLKPSNIFFSLGGQIKVGDFGLVKDEDGSNEKNCGSNFLRGHTKEVGTRLYMSPEQLKGQKYNYKVDIYSLGLIFFELIVYFSTDMERINTLISLRENHFPREFTKKYHDEYNLLTSMLCHLPEKRLTTFGIRARPPLNCYDSSYNKDYDFELPKS